ncbi:MAG: hypothetical protein GXP31_13750 [Kiritimatiellaeota bacterium]|nr:hypothetical protein [Kiritimatiellota bacterium]
MKTLRTPHRWSRVPVVAAAVAALWVAGAPQKKAGKYLYSNAPDKEKWKGRLEVRFTRPGPKVVVAYGRRYRKDRKDRAGTTEVSREKFKPYKAEMRENGKLAVFPHLPPDYYDLVVICPETMQFYEGIRMLRESNPEAATDKFFAEVKASLGRTKDRIGGWEAFFDSKEFERFETDGVRGAVLVQQMRLGKAFAESGEVLKGCIHSIDICWVERAKVEGVGWQVVTRQQLYRDELPSRNFFLHKQLSELCGLRVGLRTKAVGPIELPGYGIAGPRD